MESLLWGETRSQAAVSTSTSGADYSPAAADSLNAALLNLPNREPRSVLQRSTIFPLGLCSTCATPCNDVQLLSRGELTTRSITISWICMGTHYPLRSISSNRYSGKQRAMHLEVASTVRPCQRFFLCQFSFCPSARHIY